MQDDRLVGVGVELAGDLLRALDVEVEVVYAGAWARVLGLAEKGRIDVVPNIFRTQERQRWLHYPSRAFYHDEAVVFVRRGYRLNIGALGDLEALSGGTTRGDSWGDDVDDFVRRKGLHLASSPQTLFRQLALGRLDYAIFARFGGRAIVATAGLEESLNELPAPLSREGMFIGVAKNGDCSALARQLDRQLVAWLKRNRIEALIGKYEKLWKESGAG
mgnify:FL=1